MFNRSWKYEVLACFLCYCKEKMIEKHYIAKCSAFLYAIFLILEKNKQKAIKILVKKCKIWYKEGAICRILILQ